jgi:4-amino-4-deoxy-L-arabinose transferase-like glycosyltransferase
VIATVGCFVLYRSRLLDSRVQPCVAFHAEVKPCSTNSRRLLARAVAFLLLILFIELAFSIRRETQTWDEGCHIFAGYSYWTRGDFGMNPEHPPLLKLLATGPLLGLSLRAPAHPKIFSKEEDFTTAAQFVYANDAEKILFRARIAVSVLTLLLALMLFVATREMLGTVAGLVALALFVFEPTVLAHGALVTTDMGMSYFLFATVYSFYRYVKRPSMRRLALTTIAAGLTLATKHSGILVFPILIALAIAELLLRGDHRTSEYPRSQHSRSRLALRLAGAIIVVGVVAVVVLWAAYGFHLHPRPNVDAQDRVAEYAGRLRHPLQVKLITGVARWHLLPEPYLYGLADVGFTAHFSHTYLLGKIYPHGQWFYFPVAFVIKASLALIALLLLVPLAVAIRGKQRVRELLFLVIPAAIYLMTAMASGMNIGVRHILPIFPFLMALAGWAAAALIERRRIWAYVLAVVLIFDVISSVRAFPVYMAYANELWGGPSQTYKYLSDSNVDWAQQLKAVKQYLDQHRVTNCWFAYFGQVVADPAYYGIPCRPLTTIASVWLQPSISVPARIDGPVLISAGVLSGYEFGPGPLNPYDQFQKIRPTAVIEDGVFVFDGRFDIPLASALNHVTQAQLLAKENRLDQALSEAQLAVALAPESLPTQAQLGFILLQLKRPEEAHQAVQRALTLAQTIHPEFQEGWVPGLKGALLK